TRKVLLAKIEELFELLSGYKNEREREKKYLALHFIKQFIWENYWLVEVEDRHSLKCFLVRGKNEGGSEHCMDSAFYSVFGKPFSDKEKPKDLHSYLLTEIPRSEEKSWEVPLRFMTGRLNKHQAFQFEINIVSEQIPFGKFDWVEPFTERVFWSDRLISEKQVFGQGHQSPGQVWTIGVSLNFADLWAPARKKDKLEFASMPPAYIEPFYERLTGHIKS
ncbi:MAG: hypothetical protein ACREOP_01905, partial [Thermodesulfobacteriota bacterium]